MKACFKCGETKPLDDFYKHPRMADGRLNKCRDCTKIDERRHRIDNPEKVRSRDRERSQLPYRKALMKAAHSRERDVNPDRVRARNAVSNAVRDGKLVKQLCAFCRGDSHEAHHHDYAKPLDVTWLCRPCHRRFHALERMATYRGEAG